MRSPGARDAPYATTEVEPDTGSASTSGISVVTSLDLSCVATSSMAELSDAILSARSCAVPGRVKRAAKPEHHRIFVSQT